jgi:hypothetical protein
MSTNHTTNHTAECSAVYPALSPTYLTTFVFSEFSTHGFTYQAAYSLTNQPAVLSPFLPAFFFSL